MNVKDTVSKKCLNKLSIHDRFAEEKVTCLVTYGELFTDRVSVHNSAAFSYTLLLLYSMFQEVKPHAAPG